MYARSRDMHIQFAYVFFMYDDVCMYKGIMFYTITVIAKNRLYTLVHCTSIILHLVHGQLSCNYSQVKMP